MSWQPETPTSQLGKPHAAHRQQWQQAFMNEWNSLSEGCADLEQTEDFATELYPTHGARNPIDVAREEWGAPK